MITHYYLALLCTIVYLVCEGHGQVSHDSSEVCLTYFAKFSRNHTACLKPNKKCKLTEVGLSSRDQKLIVDIHNYYRNQIASGNETTLGFPSAANMLKMEWDPELAYVAQMHANQCEFAHDCYECRKTEHHDTVGQNLYIYQTSHASADPNWQHVIKEWYDEIKIAPPVVAQSFDLFNLNIGHFTQIAWASTNRVGCGFVTYDVSGQYSGENAIFRTAQLYTCNYAPGGNFLGEKMYEDGHSASQCPHRYSRSKRFTSLCEYSRVKVNKVNKVDKVTPSVSTNKKKVIKKKPKIVTPPPAPVAPAPPATIDWQPSPSFSNEPSSQAPAAASPQPSPQPQPQPQQPRPNKNLITSSIVAFTPSFPSSSSVSNTINSEAPSTIPASILINSSTRRVTSTNKVKTTKPSKKPNKKKQSKPTLTTSVTQTSKRVTNWWDKWSENFAKNWSTTRVPKSTSTQQQPTRWTWTWSTINSNKPTTGTSTTTGTRTTRVPFIKIEMRDQNGSLTQNVNQQI